MRAFYRQHYTAGNVLLGVGGGFDDAIVARMEAALKRLPPGGATAPPAISPATTADRSAVLIDKPGADASISFGFPLDVHRGERDFYALWIANSWLGEHRNQSSHLFHVIREIRGLNYGDYSYIEAFPEGGERTMPPVNVPRRRAAVRDLDPHAAERERAVRTARRAARAEGAGRQRHDGRATSSSRARFLKKYSLHYAETTSARLGYAMDDRFYGIDGEGHLARFRRMMDELTLEDVNAAIRKHLQYKDLKIAIVTGDAAGLRAALTSDAPTPVTYSTPKADEVLKEDREIAAVPFAVSAERIGSVPVTEAFER